MVDAEIIKFAWLENPTVQTNVEWPMNSSKGSQFYTFHNLTIPSSPPVTINLTSLENSTQLQGVLWGFNY